MSVIQSISLSDNLGHIYRNYKGKGDHENTSGYSWSLEDDFHHCSNHLALSFNPCQVSFPSSSISKAKNIH